MQRIDDLVGRYSSSVIFGFSEHIAKSGQDLERMKMIPFKCKDHYEIMYLATMKDGSNDALGISFPLNEEYFQSYLNREKIFAKEYLIPTTVFPTLKRLK